MTPAASALLSEFDAEVPATRRVLERIPAEQFAWQPHPRSMSAGQLAQHVAAIPGSVARLTRLDGLDVSTAPAVYPAASGHDALMATLDQSIVSLRAALAALDDAATSAAFRLTFHDREIANWTRLTMIRTMGLNHWYHHRGELVVYLRLIGVPVPIVYGRSADENPFAETAA
jgi:uncharacterized damage-inducible protein DinB